jgi:sugar/nucleoside kinase (ribokinase family)
VPPFKQTLMNALPYVDFLFGNENEASEFAKSEKWETTDIAEIALKVCCCCCCHRCLLLVMQVLLLMTRYTSECCLSCA